MDVGTASPAIDHLTTDWARVDRTTYFVQQTVRYTYPEPAYQLHQRLMMVPPAHHGDQTRLDWEVTSSTPARRRAWVDRFGNVSVDFKIDTVDDVVEFKSSIVLRRTAGPPPVVAPPHPVLSRPSPLTQADRELTQVAEDLRAAGGGGLSSAELICDWTWRRLAYRAGVTSIATTAADACRAGAGVCQDYAHVMLAVCRRAGVPARYVSGHLLGEGPSHAWVEVLTPTRQTDEWVATAFDPTHGRRTGLQYVTIATGRDYRDVAPTSGRCVSAAPGRLHMTKRAGLASIDYRGAVGVQLHETPLKRSALAAGPGPDLHQTKVS